MVTGCLLSVLWCVQWVMRIQLSAASTCMMTLWHNCCQSQASLSSTLSCDPPPLDFLPSGLFQDTARATRVPSLTLSQTSSHIDSRTTPSQHAQKEGRVIHHCPEDTVYHEALGRRENKRWLGTGVPINYERQPADLQSNKLLPRRILGDEPGSLRLNDEFIHVCLIWEERKRHH